MMKITIKSMDFYGEKYSKSFEIIEILNLPDKREYHYEDEFGKCRIIETENMVEIYRKGSINSRQIFKIGKVTSFTYMTKEFKAKYENRLRYISLEDLHDYLISRYEEKDFDFEPFERLVLDYIEDAKAWEDWEKKNPDYSDEQEEELDKECDMIRDEMVAILYKNNLM